MPDIAKESLCHFDWLWLYIRPIIFAERLDVGSATSCDVGEQTKNVYCHFIFLLRLRLGIQIRVQTGDEPTSR